jgi:hypothetical protein
MRESFWRTQQDAGWHFLAVPCFHALPNERNRRNRTQLQEPQLVSCVHAENQTRGYWNEKGSPLHKDNRAGQYMSTPVNKGTRNEVMQRFRNTGFLQYKIQQHSACLDLKREGAPVVNEYKYSPGNPSVGDYWPRAGADAAAWGRDSPKHPLTLPRVTTGDRGLRLDHAARRTGPNM